MLYFLLFFWWLPRRRCQRKYIRKSFCIVLKWYSFKQFLVKLFCNKIFIIYKYNSDKIIRTIISDSEWKWGSGRILLKFLILGGPLPAHEKRGQLHKVAEFGLIEGRRDALWRSQARHVNGGAPRRWRRRRIETSRRGEAWGRGEHGGTQHWKATFWMKVKNAPGYFLLLFEW